MFNKTIRGFSRLAACLLALALILGIFLGTGDGGVVLHAAAVEELLQPTKATAGEKPKIVIETNVVVDSRGTPTDYVELALKVQTPKDGDNQTTFKSLAVTLEYNDALLVPVSWEHEALYSAANEFEVINAYPDFYKEGIDITYDDDNPDAPMPYETDIKANAADILQAFKAEEQFDVWMPTLQFDTDIASAMAFVGGAEPLLSFSVNSGSIDLTLDEETPLAVVRFLYIGDDEPLSGIVDRVEGETSVRLEQLTSGHDQVNPGNAAGEQQSLFWFAGDAMLDGSPTKQILFYESGDYAGQEGGAGENEFYATKTPYNGSEVTDLPTHIDRYDGVTAVPQNFSNSTDYKDAAGDPLDRPLTGGDRATLNGVDDADYETNRWVVRARDAAGDPTDSGYYSYTSNLLYTSEENEAFTAHTNIRFGVVAKESYRSAGGVDMSNIATVVFLDWDDTILGALAVEKGDARAAVNAYVENFVHPSLRASNPDNVGRLKELATSLEREYTYAGKYPNTNVNGVDGFNVAVDSDNDGIISAAERAASDEIIGVNTFPDDIAPDENGVDLAGSSYPLTNKVDYAFLRRPVIGDPVTRTPNPNDTADSWAYLDADSFPTAATEWVTGTVDWDGTQTPTDPTDDYLYVHGWAIVEDPRESESVWTTFSGAGELSGYKLPGYDTDDDNDERNYFNNNIIRAAGSNDATVGDTHGGAESAFTTGTAGDPAPEISFATYGASEYFEFADFSDVTAEDGAIFVKACYEPAEEIHWTDNYIVVSEEPYYVRSDVLASTQDSNNYTVSFDYERINSDGFGVMRTRDPYARVEFTIDASSVEDGFREGSITYEILPLESTDVITMEFIFNSGFHAAEYTLVEVYGSESAALSINRSSRGNEAEVLPNFNYLKDDTAGGESSDNGYFYENRLGSKGYIYSATLRQIMERGTELIRTITQIEDSSSTNKDALIAQEKTNFITRYLTPATLVDLNLRLNEDGMEADETGALADYNRTNAQNAIYDALRIAYEKSVFDDTEVINLDWHQLQYHILHYTIAGDPGIETGTGIRAPGDCGSYKWCRQDNCSAEVDIPMADLKDALQAVNDFYHSGSANTRAAAEKALQDSLVDVLTAARVLDAIIISGDPADPTSTGNPDIDTLDEAKAQGKYTTLGGKYTDWRAIAAKLDELNALNLTLTDDNIAPIVQHWLDAGLSTEPEGDTKYRYWWLYWNAKPYVVDFVPETGQYTVDELVSKLVEAAVSFGEGNPRAWEELDAAVIEQMRFRSTARGDFFDDDSYASRPADYDDYRELIYDSRAEADMVLDPYTNVDAFIAAVTELIEAYGYDAASDTWKTQADIEAALGEYAWYRIQCYLLTGADTEYPAIYAGTGGMSGTYWWKDEDRDMRLVENTTADGNDPDKYGNDPEKYEYIGATMENLRTWLDRYADAVKEGDAAQIAQREAQFKIWFTPEVATDLILKADTLGNAIDGNNCTGIAGKFITLMTNNPNTDYTSAKWSQIQYFIVSNSYESEKVAQKEYTYSGRCTWAYILDTDGVTKVSNRWREDELPSITDLGEFLVSLDAYAKSQDSTAPALSDEEQKAADLFARAVALPSDLENLDFRLGSDFASLRDDDLRDALVQMRTNYNGGNPDAWAAMANSVAAADPTTFNPRDQWYLVQHYLYTGSFATPTGTESVHDATVTLAKTLYWWEYGWSGANITNDWYFYNIISKSIPAKVYYLTNSGQVGDMDYGSANMDDGDFSSYTRNILDANLKSLPWNSEALRAALLAVQTEAEVLASQDDIRNYVQFFVMHYYQYDGDDPDDYLNMVKQTYADEAGAFYWWHTGGAVPTWSITSADDYKTSAEKLARAALLRNATGALDNDGLFTDKNITDRLRLRVPPPEGSGVTAIGNLSKYADNPDTPGNDLLDKFTALVKAAYESLPTQPWDYITQSTDAATSVTRDVYTYRDVAALLTPVQIQHWFATGEYESDATTLETLKETYWWLETDSIADDSANVALLQQFVDQTLSYANGTINNTNANKWRTDVVNTIGKTLFGAGVSKITNATFAKNALNSVKTALSNGKFSGQYTWKQMYWLISKRTATDIATASDQITATPPPGLEEVYDASGNLIGGYVTPTTSTAETASASLIAGGAVYEVVYDTAVDTVPQTVDTSSDGEEDSADTDAAGQEDERLTSSPPDAIIVSGEGDALPASSEPSPQYSSAPAPTPPPQTSGGTEDPNIIIILSLLPVAA